MKTTTGQPDGAASIPSTNTAPRWTLLTPSREIVAALRAELGISDLLATLMASRLGERALVPGVARAFLHPSLDDLHDPFLMRGMEAAVTRLLAAIANGETILVYGDYDVDGTTAVIVFREAISRLGGKTEFHVPHRIAEGYGMREDVLDRAAARGIKLVVSVDTGIRAGVVVEHARQLGMDCIITDHHLPPGEGVPDALAVLNPQQPGCAYPEKNLCGVGVVFKLVDALLLRSGSPVRKKLLESFLKIVAIGTVADVVPLTGENRVIVKFGLAGLRRAVHHGLKALLAVAGLTGKDIDSGDVGFRIGPRLNAAGRMDTAADVIRLFESNDATNAAEVAERLNRLNTERQEAQQRALNEIDQMLTDHPEFLDDPALVFAAEGWHRGVVGIVAGRLLERYHRPVIVLSLEAEEAHGSGRSISKFHLLDALDAIHAADPTLFARYGGHAVAVGGSLAASRVPELRAALIARARAMLTTADLVPELRIDAAVRLLDLTPAMLDDIASLGPHGMGNPTPVLGARDLELLSARIFATKHLSMRVRQDGFVAEAIFWGRADLAERLQPGMSIALAFTAEMNEFRGESQLRLVARDLKFQSNKIQSRIGH